METLKTVRPAIPLRAGRALALSSLLAALGACAGQVADDAWVSQAAQDDADVVDRVEALGFARDEVELEGNIIRVDGDMVLYRDKLLAGGYDPVMPDSEAGFVPKGYQYSRLVEGDNQYNIKLAWAASANKPENLAIKNAIIHAAGDFNAINSYIDISQNHDGPAITVSVVSAADWPDGTGCAETDVACAEFPSFGEPGANLWVKASKVNSSCDWTSATLANRMRHELGHAIGLAHVKAANGTHIAGTAACAKTPAICANTPGYSTVMVKRPKVDAACKTKPLVLQTDDKASVRALYGSLD
jgi:hypothetical protein